MGFANGSWGSWEVTPFVDKAALGSPPAPGMVERLPNSDAGFNF